MKKNIVTLVSIVVVCTSVFVFSSFMILDVHDSCQVEGYGDGHCTKCGLHNGHYRCPAFVPTNDHPSECTCGHSKTSHAYR